MEYFDKPRVIHLKYIRLGIYSMLASFVKVIAKYVMHKIKVYSLLLVVEIGAIIKMTESIVRTDYGYHYLWHGVFYIM